MMLTTIIATILSIIGSINWLLVGLFGFNFVTWLFGAASIVTTLVYVLVGIAGIWLIFYLLYSAIAGRPADEKPAKRRSAAKAH